MLDTAFLNEVTEIWNIYERAEIIQRSLVKKIKMRSTNLEVHGLKMN